jgi:hypothetical protein
MAACISRSRFISGGVVAARRASEVVALIALDPANRGIATMPPNTSCWTQCSSHYYHGTEIRLVAGPADRYMFLGWISKSEEAHDVSSTTRDVC